MSPSEKDSPAKLGPVLSIASLVRSQTRDLLVEPDPQTMARIAEELSILGLKKLRFTGQLAPLGKRDWRLTGHLGATVVQTCVVTLGPVTTRIEEDVARNFVHDFVLPEDEEAEIPESVEDEPLGSEIDIGAVVQEALALALPPYPRADGAAIDEANFTEPGKTAMRDEDARPFAGLAALRNKLENGGEES
ncbi:MAG: DUF177 domain-containing protein [Maritimibacter sp.]